MPKDSATSSNINQFGVEELEETPTYDTLTSTSSSLDTTMVLMRSRCCWADFPLLPQRIQLQKGL
ncbi:lytic murein transglycosylase [Anopheles sinensis]|uniref:Lytic murein transglycosylase n=1 Tax=Anopheles sinensis TaxID=74873 RepID=A0A084W4C0_ANOSI|nr:lytic murein transglycosylase [Anopheles sinensis]